MPAGRPSSYSEEIADDICELLCSGMSLLKICDQGPPFPPQSVVFQWLSKSEEFAEKYARARQFWAESEFERMMQIADTPQPGVITTETSKGVETKTADMIEHRRLQVDARKWALARMSPRKYGDRLAHQALDEKGNPTKGGITVIVDGAR